MTGNEALAENRERLRGLFETAVAAVSADVAMPRKLAAARDGRTAIIAIGKAAAPMMHVAMRQVANPIAALLVTRHGHLGDIAFPAMVEVIEAGHPATSDWLRA